MHFDSLKYSSVSLTEFQNEQGAMLTVTIDQHR